MNTKIGLIMCWIVALITIGLGLVNFPILYRKIVTQVWKVAVISLLGFGFLHMGRSDK